MKVHENVEVLRSARSIHGVRLYKNLPVPRGELTGTCGSAETLGARSLTLPRQHAITKITWCLYTFRFQEVTEACDPSRLRNRHRQTMGLSVLLQLQFLHHHSSQVSHSIKNRRRLLKKRRKNCASQLHKESLSSNPHPLGIILRNNPKKSLCSRVPALMYVGMVQMYQVRTWGRRYSGLTYLANALLLHIQTFAYYNLVR